MSLRDLATTALCAPTGTSSTSAAASSSSNPLAQLAESVLPTVTRPEHVTPSTQPAPSIAELLGDGHQHQQQQQQQHHHQQQLDAPHLPANLFPSHAPPPVPAPVVGDPTDVFEKAFSSSVAETPAPTIGTAAPQPPAHMVHPYQRPSSSSSYHHYARPPLPSRSSWRDGNSSFSQMMYQPFAPPPIQMYNNNSTVHPVNFNPQQQQPVTNEAVASSSTQRQQQRQTERTNEQIEVAALRQKQQLEHENEAMSDSLQWSQQFSSLHLSDNQQTSQAQSESIEATDSFLFDETLQSAFQHWLRRDSTDAYHFLTTNQTTNQTAAATTRAESLQHGIKAHNEGRLSAAVYHLEQALNHKGGEEDLAVSKQALAWYVLGLSLADLDHDERSIQALTKGLSVYDGSKVGQRREENPYIWQSLIALSVSYTNELEHSKALRSMREWLDIRQSSQGEGGNLQSTQLLGGTKDIFNKQSGYEDILSNLNRIAEQNTKDIDVFIVLGILHNLNRDYDSAAIVLRHAVTLKPDIPNVWNKLGATLANGGNSGEALRAYRKAVDLQPALVRAWVNVGTAYSNRSEYAKAVRYYLKAIAISKESSSASNEMVLGQGDYMSHVWGYLRSSLISLSRPDLLQLVESRDSDSLRAHFNY